MREILSNYNLIFLEKNSMTWEGPTPAINTIDPKLIREIFYKYEIFHKPKSTQLPMLHQHVLW